MNGWRRVRAEPAAWRSVTDFAAGRRWVWFAFMWGWAATVLVAVLADVHADGRSLIVVSFVLCAPGLAFVRLLGIDDIVWQLLLAIATSVSIAVLLSLGMIYSGTWSPKGAVVVLVAIAVAASLTELKRR